MLWSYSLPSQFLPTSLSTQLTSYSLSQKKKQNKTKPPNHNKSKHTNKNKKNMESSLCWSTIKQQGTYPGVWLIHPWSLHWKKKKTIFPLPEG